MLEVIFALLCIPTLGFLVLTLRSYEYMSAAELKRRARKGHKKAKAVYSVRGAYGNDVFVVLWGLIGIISSIFVLLLEAKVWALGAVLFSIPVTVMVHAVLPWSKYPEPSLNLAAASAPVMYRVLIVFSPLIKLLSKLTGSWIVRNESKRVHSKEELVDLLEQTQIEDDPFSKDELSIAVHALTFGNKAITEVMTPISVVKTMKSTDVLSPVLLGELHESGHSRFPVINDKDGSYVGMLYSKDLELLRDNKQVKDVMKHEVFYVNEFSSLDNVLNAFLQTKHHLFMVVNEYEDIVGVISIEDVLEQVLGRQIIDEFDKYGDLRLVARQLADEKAKQREKVL